jgi:hypothetical protein
MNGGCFLKAAVRFTTRERVFLLQNFETVSEAHRASQSMGIDGSFSGIKRPGLEADHSPYLVPGLKRRCTATHYTGLHDEHRDRFISSHPKGL